MGDYFGEAALITEEKVRQANVQALTDLTVLYLDYDEF